MLVDYKILDLLPVYKVVFHDFPTLRLLPFGQVGLEEDLCLVASNLDKLVLVLILLPGVGPSSFGSHLLFLLSPSRGLFSLSFRDSCLNKCTLDFTIKVGLL